MELDRKMLVLMSEKIVKAEDLQKIELGRELGTLRWTGWKSYYALLEKHAQFVLFPPIVSARNKFLYVDIPSMRHGEIELGQSMDVGPSECSKYFWAGETTVEEVRLWIREALELLVSDIIMKRPDIVDSLFGEEK